MAVTDPKGSSAGAIIIREIKSQNKLRKAPDKKLAGIKIRLSDVLNTSLVIWGTAKPIKDTGPAKAVTAAANKLDITMICLRMPLMFKPILWAYFSPKSMTFNFLPSIKQYKLLGTKIAAIYKI